MLMVSYHREYAPEVVQLSVVVSKTTAFEQESCQEVAPEPIHVTHGYSRAHRPDLKQFMVDLICNGIKQIANLTIERKWVKPLAKSLAQDFRQIFPNQDLTVLTYGHDKKLILTAKCNTQSKQIWVWIVSPSAAVKDTVAGWKVVYLS